MSAGRCQFLGDLPDLRQQPPHQLAVPCHGVVVTDFQGMQSAAQMAIVERIKSVERRGAALGDETAQLFLGLERSDPSRLPVFLAGCALCRGAR